MPSLSKGSHRHMPLPLAPPSCLLNKKQTQDAGGREGEMSVKLSENLIRLLATNFLLPLPPRREPITKLPKTTYTGQQSVEWEVEEEARGEREREVIERNSIEHPASARAQDRHRFFPSFHFPLFLFSPSPQHPAAPPSKTRSSCFTKSDVMCR